MMNNRQFAHRRKVAVVGAGAVGSTFCYALAQSGLADEIALIDQNENLVRGQVLDLVHGQPFFPTVSIKVGSTEDYVDARVIVITAGAAQKPGETRLQLMQKNAAIMRNIIQDIVASQTSAVVVVVSNPVDIMTHVAIDAAAWELGRIIGSGTVLDSARLRHFISAHCEIDVHNVHAYMLGEHGDSEFAAWSMAHVGGTPMDEYCGVCGQCDEWPAQRSQIEQNVRDSAYHIIDYKGATFFAVGLALVRITRAILRGERSVLTVSTKLEGQFGLRDVCLSVPCIVSGKGVERVLESKLSEEEMSALSASAQILHRAIDELRASS
jgi:L-lactate dehydrogenase